MGLSPRKQGDKVRLLTPRAGAYGGATKVDNLAPLCRHHHIIRHHAHWTHQPLPTGDHQMDEPPRPHLHHQRPPTTMTPAPI